MNKKILVFLLLIVMSSLLIACSSDVLKDNTTNVNLAADQRVLIADGIDDIKFEILVKDQGEEIIDFGSSELEFYFDDEIYNEEGNFDFTLEGNVLTTEEAGDYHVYVMYKGEKSNKIYIEANNDLVLVNGGTFKMGDWQEMAKIPEDIYQEYGNIKDYSTEIGELDGKYKDDFTFDALNLHDITLDSYYIAEHETTFGDYIEFLEQSGNDLDSKDLDAIKNIILSRKEDQTEEWIEGVEAGEWFDYEMPVVGITWYDAVKFCNWKSERDGFEKVYNISNYSVTMNQRASGYRLPTEAEWEYAARGGEKMNVEVNDGYGHIFSGASTADEWDNYVWHANRSDNENKPIPVKSLKANELGLYDMSGNVWEFCWDFYDPDYYDYGETYNPTGPKGPYDSVVAQSGEVFEDFETRSHTKVLRGGSWGNTGVFVRSTFRFFSIAQYYDSEDVEQISSIYASWRSGFRIVRNAE